MSWHIFNSYHLGDFEVDDFCGLWGLGGRRYYRRMRVPFNYVLEKLDYQLNLYSHLIATQKLPLITHQKRSAFFLNSNFSSSASKCLKIDIFYYKVMYYLYKKQQYNSRTFVLRNSPY